MTSDVYRRLAERLDAIPNGFEPTQTGMKLLAKLFTEEEAQLGTVMRLSFEAPAAIASRAGVDEGRAGDLLAGMAGKGLVRAAHGADAPTYGLMPFAVGIYEEALPRMDEEMASLFEDYYRETGGGPMTHYTPALQRIIPVGESIPVDLQIFPYERASEYIENSRSWGVRDCVCRVQQRLIGKGCDRPVESCLIFAPVDGAFDGSGSIRPITKEESLRILRESADAGLVHSTMNQKGQLFYICNCCTCCCGILRGVKEFGIPTAVARSDFRVAIDAEACAACVACVDRCQFDALEIEGDVCRVDYDRCVGCGVCVSHCSFDAMKMERRPVGETPEPPENRRAWLAERAESRGISLSDIE
ncbi:MAG: 4Fe-4S binding protein [Candidatus Eisenbacteria bacterium]